MPGGVEIRRKKRAVSVKRRGRSRPRKLYSYNNKLVHNVRDVMSHLGDDILVKTSEEVIIHRCKELDLSFVGTTQIKGNTHVLFQCPNHIEKGVQSKIWSKFKRSKYGCKYCAGKGWSTEDFKAYIAKNNPTIEVIGEYAGDASHIKCRCRRCNRIWSPIAHNIKRGSKCTVCSFQDMGLRKRASFEDVQNKIWQAQPNINIIGDYHGTHKKVHCKCTVCGTEWEAMPSNLIRLNTGCPICKQKDLIQNLRWSQHEVDEMLRSRRPDVILKSNYNTFNDKMICYCAEHGVTYQQSLARLLEGHRGCQACQKKSNGEIRLRTFLDQIGISYEPQKSFEDCKHVKVLKFDFYLPEYNIAIEYDGEGHYKPIDFAGKGPLWAKEQFLLNQKRDAIKNNYCDNNNIMLIRIPYFEYDNMETYLINQLKSRISIHTQS